MAVLDEAGVVRRDAERRQRDQHLGAALGVRGPAAGEAAPGVLEGAQAGQPAGGGVAHVGAVPISGERLERHGGQVRVARAGEAPAAVRPLGREDLGEVRLPRGAVIAPGVEGDQRPDRAVDALPADLVHVAQRREEVPAVEVGGVLPQGGEGEDDTAVVGVLLRVEHAVVRGEIGRQVGAVGVPHGRGDVRPAAREAEDGPLAADGAELRRGRGGPDGLDGRREGVAARRGRGRGDGAQEHEGEQEREDAFHRRRAFFLRILRGFYYRAREGVKRGQRGRKKPPGPRWPGGFC